MTSPAAPAPNPRPLSMWLRFAALAAVAPLAWAIARLDAVPHVKLCLFQVVTGRPCPGCGMTRSLLALAQGDLPLSLRMHPLGVGLAAMLVSALVGTAAGLVRGDDPVRTFLARRGSTLVVVLIAAFVLQWVVRGIVCPSWAPDPVGG